MRKKASTSKTAAKTSVSKKELSEIAALKAMVLKLTRRVLALENWKKAIDLKLDALSKSIFLFDAASSGMATMAQVMNQRMNTLLGKLTEVFPIIKDVDTEMLNTLMRDIEGKMDKAVKAAYEDDETE